MKPKTTLLSAALALLAGISITSAPLLVDYSGGNLRLQSNSPCINAGNSSYVTTSTDLDGRPCIVLRSNLPGQPGSTSFTDTSPVTAAPRFYRVRVEP